MVDFAIGFLSNLTPVRVVKRRLIRTASPQWKQVVIVVFYTPEMIYSLSFESFQQTEQISGTVTVKHLVEWSVRLFACLSIHPPSVCLSLWENHTNGQQLSHLYLYVTMTMQICVSWRTHLIPLIFHDRGSHWIVPIPRLHVASRTELLATSGLQSLVRDVLGIPPPPEIWNYVIIASTAELGYTITKYSVIIAYFVLISTL